MGNDALIKGMRGRKLKKYFPCRGGSCDLIVLKEYERSEVKTTLYYNLYVHFYDNLMLGESLSGFVLFYFFLTVICSPIVLR